MMGKRGLISFSTFFIFKSLGINAAINIIGEKMIGEKMEIYISLETFVIRINLPWLKGKIKKMLATAITIYALAFLFYNSAKLNIPAYF